MFNTYLSNLGYENATISEIERSFIELNDIIINKKGYENFLMSENLYYLKIDNIDFVNIINSQMSDKQFMQNILPKLLNSIYLTDKTFENLDEIDNMHKDVHNCFYGAKFTIENERHIDSSVKYYKFLNNKKRDIDSVQLWNNKDCLFDRIILCNSVEEYFNKNNSNSSLVINALIDIEEYCIKYWNEGGFNYKDACKKGLEISPESKSTNNNKKLKKDRMFKLPNGKTEYFELHLKLNDIRIHIFPYNLKIYVGYIGSHLSTSKYKT